mgnify:CR=1 FL=1
MSRADAIARAQEYFDGGIFKSDLARRVAIPTESQNPERAGELARYVETEMKLALEALGFRCRVLRHAKALPKSGWKRADLDRPLDDSGRADAKTLADLLACFAPRPRLINSTPARCT